MSAAMARPTGPVSVLADGLTVAASSSRLLRGPSIYLGLLTLALAGPGLTSQLWVLSWSESVDLVSRADVDAANQVIGFSAILLAVALAGIVAVSIEGGAIGAMLIAGRVTGRPVTLRLALERSRRVFWRLVRAALVIGVIEIIASIAWRAVTNAPQTIEGVPNLGVEPIPGAIVSMPFIFSTIAIVVADDGARAALRRSARLARQRLRLAAALAAFALLSGVLEALALGSGLDLIVRLTEALNLDVTAGAASLVVAILLGLAIVTAAGSLVFTVSALVSAPQIVAWDRLGLPTLGLPPAAEAAPAEPTPAEAAPAEPTPGEPVPTDALVPAVALASAMAVAPTSTALDALTPNAADVLVPAPAPPAVALAPAGTEAAGPGPATPESPAVTARGAPAPPEAPSAWAIGAATPLRFRWVTIPMRLAIVSLWLTALALVLGGLPG
jgi:hypothetical protein